MLHDLRLAIRSLRQAPRLTAFAVLSMALGIGINTTVFTFVNALQFRPLPYAAPDRLVDLHEESATELCQGCGVGTSYPGYLEWIAETRSYKQVAAYTGETFLVSGRAEPSRIGGAMVSGGFFSVLGVPPSHGRVILADDDQRGSAPVVVLSDGLWRRLFASDPAAVGMPLKINGRLHTVIGVMPPRVELPEFAKLWVPLTPNVREWARDNRALGVIARLNDAATIASAATELRTIAARQERANPATNARWTAGVTSLHGDLASETVPASTVLMGAVMLVLLICCANLASLLLVRAATRQREMAVRATLGASRFQLARQLVTESVLLAALGGVAGLGVASWSHNLLPRLLQTDIPQWIDFSFDWRVLLFCCLASLASGVAFGLAPALHASRPDLDAMLRESAATSTARRGGRLRNTFVVAQLAMAMLLLTGAGLLIKTLVRASRPDMGYETAHLVRADLPLDSTRYHDPGRIAQMARDIEERLAGATGGRAAMSHTQFFAGFGAQDRRIAVEDKSDIPEGASPRFYDAITPGYFQTLGVRLLEGREFTDGDVAARLPVAIVNEEMAARIWPGEQVLGRHIRFGGGGSPEPWRTVVGVVASVRQTPFGQAARPSLAYVPLASAVHDSLTLLLRVNDRNPTTVLKDVRATVAGLDPDQPVENLAPLDEWFRRWMAGPRFIAAILVTLAGVSLFLAAAGIYGVTSYSALQRTQEIGIRLALGATTRDIRALMLGHGAMLAAIGVALGLAGAAAVTRLLRGVLFGTSPTDPMVFSMVTFVLAAVAIAAAYVPVRRASRIAPLIALRRS